MSIDLDTAAVWLFVPGERADRFDKACATGADAVVIDFEDAVRDEAKPRARNAVAAWLSPAEPVVIRVNAAGTPWFAEDLQLARRPEVAAIMLPKASKAALANLAFDKPVIALIESAAGMATARAVAAHPSVARLAFGALDFALDLGLDGPDEALDGFRLELAMASRLAGKPAPIDGVTVQVGDDARAAADARRARSLGFGGKLCIHPGQIDPVRRSFAPTEPEIAWARRIIDADTGSGAAASGGEMIDEPVRRRARRILAAAGIA